VLFRSLTAVNQDALGGNYSAVARFEAEFPLGIPNEYGLKGGLFLDAGSVWSLDDTEGTAGPVDDSFHLRAVLGVSIFWTTPIGPLAWIGFGRPRRAQGGGGPGGGEGYGGGGRPPRGPIAPDDDPDFLRKLDREMPGYDA
jgi:hypothetical protein